MRSGLAEKMALVPSNSILRLRSVSARKHNCQWSDEGTPPALPLLLTAQSSSGERVVPTAWTFIRCLLSPAATDLLSTCCVHAYHRHTSLEMEASSGSISFSVSWGQAKGRTGGLTNQGHRTSRSQRCLPCFWSCS